MQAHDNVRLCLTLRPWTVLLLLIMFIRQVQAITYPRCGTQHSRQLAYKRLNSLTGSSSGWGVDSLRMQDSSAVRAHRWQRY